MKKPRRDEGMDSDPAYSERSLLVAHFELASAKLPRCGETPRPPADRSLAAAQLPAKCPSTLGVQRADRSEEREGGALAGGRHQCLDYSWRGQSSIAWLPDWCERSLPGWYERQHSGSVRCSRRPGPAIQFSSGSASASVRWPKCMIRSPTRGPTARSRSRGDRYRTPIIR